MGLPPRADVLRGSQFGAYCAGLGTLCRAMAAQGLPTAIWWEKDEQKAKFLADQFPDALPRADMLSFEPILVLLPGPLHIVGGGPPCVMASTAGKRLGMDDPRAIPTTEGIAAIVKQLGPQVSSC